MLAPGEIAQHKISIVLADFLQQLDHHQVFLMRGGGHAHALRPAEQVQKQQSHLGAANLQAGGLGRDERMHNALQQPLDLADLGHAEVQVGHVLLIIAQRVQQEPAQHVMGADHIGHKIQKLLLDQEVDRDVVFPAPGDAVRAVAVDQQQLARLQAHRAAVGHAVQRFALQHIHHFHIVVPVHGKIGKARMRPQRDHLPRGHKALALHDEGAAVGIASLRQGFAAQQAFFLLRMGREKANQAVVHAWAPFGEGMGRTGERFFLGAIAPPQAVVRCRL